MKFDDQIEDVQSRLSAYYKVDAPQMGVAGVGGIPPDMFDGDVDGHGWVAWKMLPSTLAVDDVKHVEREFSIEFPPMFRAICSPPFSCSTRYTVRDTIS